MRTQLYKAIAFAALFAGQAMAAGTGNDATADSAATKDSVTLAPPPLPTHVQAFDVRSDNGKAFAVTWLPDPSVPATVRYQIGVATQPTGPFYLAMEAPAAGPRVKDDPKVFGWAPRNPEHQFAIVSSYTLPATSPGANEERVEIAPDRTYYLRFAVVGDSSSAELTTPLSVTPRQNWIKLHKINNLIFGLLFGAVILTFIELARRNPNMFIRKIAGLDAVEEALGRATEMGKPVYFVHGLNSMGEVSAIASINILGRVARRVAQFDTTLKVMNNDPIVLAVSQEVVREACIDVGRPDAYVADNIMFVADRQFSYAAAVDGMMMRERPATVMLMGYFYAEALLFAETGNSVGAIQIAATDSYTQIPFFITTCDYTLIGEELYAASAYLAREPKLLGSLRGQDIGKAVLIAILTIGTALELAGFHWLTRLVAPL